MGWANCSRCGKDAQWMAQREINGRQMTLYFCDEHHIPMLQFIDYATAYREPGTGRDLVGAELERRRINEVAAKL